MAHRNEVAGDRALNLLGKKQELKRRFGFWSLLGFATAELIIWESILSLLSLGFTNGGPAGLLNGYFISWFSSCSIYLVISELASMAPISAGQYYWVYMLAPEKLKVFSSYIIGWLTIMAWVATIATDAIYAGTIVQGLMVMRDTTYVGTSWQGALLAWAVIGSGLLINILTPAGLPKFEIGVIIWHVAGFISIVAVLWTLSPHAEASFPWTTTVNEGGWPTQGLSFLVGYIGNISIFVGADASVHMAEEVSNPAKNIPRAIMFSMTFNGIIGLITMLTVLYCLGDVSSILNSFTGYPFLQVFLNSVESTPGAIALGAITLIMIWACAIGICTTASRVLWSFARDSGVPFSSTLQRVDKRTQIPIIAIIVTTTAGALLCLIYIGSALVFDDVVSLTISGFYGSYILPSAFLLWRRITGQVKPHQQFVSSDDPEGLINTAQGEIEPIGSGGSEMAANVEKSTTAQSPGTVGVGAAIEIETAGVVHNELMWGPWKVPGILGTINNIYACTYMIFVIFVSFWPSVTPVTAATMNYSVVVTGVVIIFSVFWYLIKGRKVYKGPTIDIEVVEIVLNTHVE